MSVHSRGLFKRHKRLSFSNPLIDDAVMEAAEVTNERLKPITVPVHSTRSQRRGVRKP